MPTVSVIVPNYNHARFLRKRIDSVLQQTFQDFELILLDDCSTDDSRSVISSYSSEPRVRIEFNNTNSGSTFKQWNKGVRLARGEYVWIAESDDYADVHLLEQLIAILDAKPKVALAFCRSWRIAEDGQQNGFGDFYLESVDPHRWTVDYCADGREECRNYFVRANSVPNASSVVFRKGAFDQVGGADETLRLCGDWKLWAAMALTGELAYLAEPLNYFRFHDASVRNASKQAALLAAEYLHVMRWLIARVTPTEAARRKLRQELLWLWAPAVTTWCLPLDRRWSILRDAIAIDPANTLRGVIPVGLGGLRRKFLRYWRSVHPAT